MSALHRDDAESLALFDHDLEARQDKHSKIWNAIFRDETWITIASGYGLDLALIGEGLHNLYYDISTEETKENYIVLVTGDKSGDIRFHRRAFFDSLKEPYIYNNHAKEVVFLESNIILNVEDAINNPEFISLQPKRLLSSKSEDLHSALLYFHDSDYKIYRIGSQDIVGIGGASPSLQNASHICGMTLTRPTIPQKQYFQQCFRDPKCNPVSPISPVGYKYNGDNCLGWEWQ